MATELKTFRIRYLAFLVVSQTILAVARTQTATVILANEAAAHVGEYANR